MTYTAEAGFTDQKIKLPFHYMTQRRADNMTGQMTVYSIDKPKWQPLKYRIGDIHIQTDGRWGYRDAVVQEYIWHGFGWEKIQIS